MPRNPLPAQTRRLPQFTYYCLWGETVYFAPPSPIFDLVQVQYICFLSFYGTDEQLFLSTSFYPVNAGLPVERTAVTRTAHYPFGTSS